MKKIISKITLLLKELSKFKTQSTFKINLMNYLKIKNPQVETKANIRNQLETKMF